MSTSSQALVPTTAAKEETMVNPPNNIMLEEFKHQVKMWMEIDNQIKTLQQTVREKRAVREALTPKILSFMSKFNIEDLNTREGKLRYRVLRVKPPLRQSEMKERLSEVLTAHDPSKVLQQKVFEQVFEDPPNKMVVEKPALRRIKR
jgi:hypothetical protein